MKQSSKLILCGGVFCKLKCSLTADLCLKSAGFSKGLCCIILGWIRNGHLGFLYSLIGWSVNKKGKLSKPPFVEIAWRGFCKLLIPLNVLLRQWELRFIMVLEIHTVSNTAPLMNIFFEYVKYI